MLAVSGSALAWFKSYLSDCHKFVAVNEEVSYRSQVQYGVPQGSVLGPLLFKTLHVTIGKYHQETLIWGNTGNNFLCYADDTQLFNLAYT